MRKRFGMTAIIMILLLVFVFSVGGTLAAWQSSSSTINKVTIASVNGIINEVYDQGQTVLPGDTIDKIVNVKNTGTADSIVRVKVEKAWGEDRDQNGILIINQSLPTDNIQITFDTVDWYYDVSDGYYYYKHVLEPGESTVAPLFKEFHVTNDTDNEFENMQADIKISMECIQAGENAVSYWGKDLKQLGIAYIKPAKPATDTSVIFVNPQHAFRFEGADGGNLFANFKNLIPGENASQVINITNEYEQNTAIYLRADITDQPQATVETRDLIDKLLKEYATIVITDDNGKVIYQGPVWGNLDGRTNGDSMKDQILLGEFVMNDMRKYNVSISLDSDMDNEYQNLLGLIKWVFSAEGVESEVPTSPKTGDIFPLGIYLLMMVVSGGTLLALGFIGYKNKKTAK